MHKKQLKISMADEVFHKEDIELIIQVLTHYLNVYNEGTYSSYSKTKSKVDKCIRLLEKALSQFGNKNAQKAKA